MSKRLDDYQLQAKIQKVMDGTDPITNPGQGIIAAERDKVTGPFDDFKAKLLVGGDDVRDDRTPHQIAQKIRARIVLEPIFNHFQKINVKNNSLISDASKITWGVHIDSLVRHVIGEGPHSFAVVSKTDKNTPLHLKFNSISNITPGSKALGDDVTRCDAFVYVFMNTGGVPTPEPESEDQFIKRAETTDDLIDLAFTLEEKGKRVKILLQYFNGKGHGPSSEIIDIIIP